MHDVFKHIRNSRMALGEVYFWTDTVNNWKFLLKDDSYKRLITDTWREQTEKQHIEIYGFVIMPNHLHVLWKLLNKNGKEMPHASFNKATSHLIVKDLKKKDPTALSDYKTDEKERMHRIWQRDPLAVLMNTKAKAEQKLRYMHLNPLQERWNLADRPENYTWSSAKYYETGHDEFGFLTHYAEAYGN